MSSTTVRISTTTHKKLKQLADQSGVSIGAILEKAVEEYRREQWMREMNEGYARLRADPVAWQEELEERAAWECTLMDGLEDDPWIDESSEEKSGSPISTPSADASREVHAPA